jgi:hypothetical protein
MTSATLARKGIRHPQSRNSCSEVRVRHECKRRIGENHAGRPAGLRETGRESAALGVRPFGGEQDASAPFAPDAHPLNQATDRQEHRTPDTDGVVGGHEADPHGRNAHRHHRHDEQRLAADPVPVVAADCGANRPRGEPDEDGRERKQRADKWINSGKKFLWKDGRRRDAIE